MPRKSITLATVLIAALLGPRGTSAAEPIKALLITGGCCHDYAFQARALMEAPAGRGRIAWTVVNEGGAGTRAEIALYDDPNWAASHDVIVHNECFSDPVFIETVVSGLLWAAARLEDRAEAAKEGGAALPAAADWAHGVRLPAGEKPTDLFNGKDLTGWEGQIERHWSVAGGAVRGANSARLPASTYLFTKGRYRDFRLLLEVKQTRSPQHSTMHSAVAVLGEKIVDQGDAFGFRGPLLMFCNDWGIWDAHGRNRIEPAGHGGTFNPPGVERAGEWNQIEVLVRGDRIRLAANGKLVFDFTDKPGHLRASPIGLQLHSNDRPQEYHFRGLVIVESPTDELATLTR